jgi:hypothetical protein
MLVSTTQYYTEASHSHRVIETPTHTSAQTTNTNTNHSPHQRSSALISAHPVSEASTHSNKDTNHSSLDLDA